MLSKGVQFALNYYRAQSVRDRRALQILIVFVSITLFYSLLWQPLHDWRNSLAQDYHAARELRAWVASNPRTIKTLAEKRHLPTPESLLSVVSESSARHSLEISRLNPVDDERLEITLLRADFKALLVWLQELESHHGITIENLSLNKSESAGQVTATLQLLRLNEG